MAQFVNNCIRGIIPLKVPKSENHTRRQQSSHRRTVPRQIYHLEVIPFTNVHNRFGSKLIEFIKPENDQKRLAANSASDTQRLHQVHHQSLLHSWSASGFTTSNGETKGPADLQLEILCKDCGPKVEERYQNLAKHFPPLLLYPKDQLNLCHFALAASRTK